MAIDVMNNSQMIFQGNHTKIFGGAIDSSQHVAI